MAATGPFAARKKALFWGVRDLRTAPAQVNAARLRREVRPTQSRASRISTFPPVLLRLNVRITSGCRASLSETSAE